MSYCPVARSGYPRARSPRHRRGQQWGRFYFIDRLRAQIETSLLLGLSVTASARAGHLARGPHGQSPWHPIPRPAWGDIPPTRSLERNRGAHGQRPWPDGGVAITGRAAVFSHQPRSPSNQRTWPIPGAPGSSARSGRTRSWLRRPRAQRSSGSAGTCYPRPPTSDSATCSSLDRTECWCLVCPSRLEELDEHRSAPHLPR